MPKGTMGRKKTPAGGRRTTVGNDGNRTIIRQLEMLRMIPRYPARIGTRELVERLADLDFPVTIRTVQRDLDDLSTTFGLIDDGHRPTGWSWAADVVRDIPGMDLMTALAFRMARLHLTPMLPPACIENLAPHFEQADKLLDGDGPGPKTWPKRVLAVSRHFLLERPLAILQQTHGPEMLLSTNGPRTSSADHHPPQADWQTLSSQDES